MAFPPRGSTFAKRKQSSTRAELPSDRGGSLSHSPRRRFGQNFLIDASAARRIVAALALAPSDNVLEIGPGRGALTEALLSHVTAISAIEIDRDLAALLRARYPEDRLRLIERDVLQVPFDAPPLIPPLVIAGNLPYNISKPVAMKLIVERHAVSRAVLMFQREVADRLTAVPGTAAYGPLTVLAGRSYRVERLFDLAPGAFQPRPKVRSSVTRWTRLDPDVDLPSAMPRLRAVLAAAFARRRQTLRKNLRAALPGGDDAAVRVLKTAGLDGSLRAEAIPPEGFVALARAWPIEQGP